MNSITREHPCISRAGCALVVLCILVFSALPAAARDTGSELRPVEPFHEIEFKGNGSLCDPGESR